MTQQNATFWVWDPGGGAHDPKFELGPADIFVQVQCTYPPTKINHHTFSRSEVIVLTNKRTNKRTSGRCWKQPPSLRYVTPVEKTFSCKNVHLRGMIGCWVVRTVIGVGAASSEPSQQTKLISRLQECNHLRATRPTTTLPLSSQQLQQLTKEDNARRRPSLEVAPSVFFILRPWTRMYHRPSNLI